jgi:hypothetical protein
MVVAVMLVCSLVYAWWQRSRRPAAVTGPIAVAQNAQKTSAQVHKADEPAPTTPAVASNPETAPETAASTAAAGQGTETERQAKPAAPPAPPDEAPNPAATLQVSLTADTDDWVRVATDGKVVMSDVLHPSEVKTFAAVEALRIRIGDAGNLQMTVNGKAAGPLGPKGQVCTVEVTRDGVHILPPPPKPAPAPAPEPL